MPKKAAAEESIYALIPPPAPVVIKPPMHRSKYPHNTAPTMSTFGMSATATNMITNAGGEYEAAAPAHSHKHPCASMGPGASIPKDPHNFMRSRGADTLPEPQKFEYPKTVAPKPAVPSKDETTITGLTTTKNFVVANAVNNILMEPKSTAAVQPNWLEKEDFGRVPAYLTQVKDQIQREYAMVRTVQEQAAQQHQKMRLLSEEERLELLGALKAKWEKVNGEFQQLTHQTVLDTMGKVRRKEAAEKGLDQLEKDIKRLEKKHVYVAED